MQAAIHEVDFFRTVHFTTLSKEGATHNLESFLIYLSDLLGSVKSLVEVIWNGLDLIWHTSNSVPKDELVNLGSQLADFIINSPGMSLI